MAMLLGSGEMSMNYIVESYSMNSFSRDKAQMSARYSRSELLSHGINSAATNQFGGVSTPQLVRQDASAPVQLLGVLETFLVKVGKRTSAAATRGMAVFTNLPSSIDDDTQMFLPDASDASELSQIWKPIIEAIRVHQEAGRAEGNLFLPSFLELTAVVLITVHKSCAQPYSSDFAKLSNDDHARVLHAVVAGLEAKDAAAIADAVRMLSAAYRPSSPATTLLETIAIAWSEGSACAGSFLAWLARQSSAVDDQQLVFSMYGGGVLDMAENVAHSLLNGDTDLIDVLLAAPQDLHNVLSALMSWSMPKISASPTNSSSVGTQSLLWSNIEEPPFVTIFRAKPLPLVEGLHALATVGQQQEVSNVLGDMMVCADAIKAQGLLRTLLGFAQEAVPVAWHAEKSYRKTIASLRQVLSVVCCCHPHFSSLLCSLSLEESGGRMPKASARTMSPRPSSLAPQSNTPQLPVATTFAGVLLSHFPGGIFAVTSNQKVIDTSSKATAALMSALSQLKVGSYGILVHDAALRVPSDEMKLYKAQTGQAAKAWKAYRSRNAFMKNLSNTVMSSLESSHRKGTFAGGSLRRAAMSMRVTSDGEPELRKQKTAGMNFPMALATTSSFTDFDSVESQHDAPQLTKKALEHYLSRMEKAVSNREPAVFRQVLAAREQQRAEQLKAVEERRRLTHERFFHRRLEATRITEGWAKEGREQFARESEMLDRSINKKPTDGEDEVTSFLLTPRTREILEVAKRQYVEEKKNKVRGSTPQPGGRSKPARGKNSASDDPLNSSAPPMVLSEHHPGGKKVPQSANVANRHGDRPPRTPTPNAQQLRQPADLSKPRPLPPPSREGHSNSAKKKPADASKPPVAPHSPQKTEYIDLHDRQLLDECPPNESPADCTSSAAENHDQQIADAAATPSASRSSSRCSSPASDRSSHSSRKGEALSAPQHIVEHDEASACANGEGIETSEVPTTAMTDSPTPPPPPAEAQSQEERLNDEADGGRDGAIAASESAVDEGPVTANEDQRDPQRESEEDPKEDSKAASEQMDNPVPAAIPHCLPPASSSEANESAPADDSISAGSNPPHQAAVDPQLTMSGDVVVEPSSPTGQNEVGPTIDNDEVPKGLPASADNSDVELPTIVPLADADDEKKQSAVDSDVESLEYADDVFDS